MDYKQSSVTGESWQRCLHIEINNPSGATPSIRFDEERRIALADGTSIGTPAGSIQKDFTDPTAVFQLLDPATGNPVGSVISHGEVYAILWSLYMSLAVTRDATTLE
jgi:hypothetical protein